MSQLQVLKALFREEKEIEIWKVSKLCRKGEISMSTLNRKFNGECAAQKRLSEAEQKWTCEHGKKKLCYCPLETNRDLESQRLELYQATFEKFCEQIVDVRVLQVVKQVLEVPKISSRDRILQGSKGWSSSW